MKQTRKKLGSILDAFLTLLILLSVLGIVFRSCTARGINQSDFVPREVVLQMREVLPTTIACITVGENLYDVSGKLFGVVRAVERSKTKFQIQQNGVWLEGEWNIDERCDVIVRIEVMGTEKEGRFFLAGTDAVLFGKEMELYGEKIRMFGRLQ